MFSSKGFLLFSLALITAFLLVTGYKFSKESGETYDKLPALNYYTLDVPKYFFYDPVVTNESGERNRPLKEQTNSLPGMDTVFGPNNYLRYEVRDIDLELPEPPDNDYLS